MLLKKELARKGLAEGLGTFVLVFIGTGAIVLNDRYNGALSNLGVSLAFGAAVCIAIYAFGRVSGAHINPAVTVGFWAAKRLPATEVPWYISFQVLGALGASFLLHSLAPEHLTLGMTKPALDLWLTFLLEVGLTFVLMYVILQVSTKARYSHLVGVVVGATVMLASLSAGPLTGASMNPARSLSPALAAGVLKSSMDLFNRSPGGSLIEHSRMETNEKKVVSTLVLCTGNSCRSQMAEGYIRYFANGQMDVVSAGVETHGVNPYAIRVMKEDGIDISNHTSNNIDEYADRNFDAVITVCDNAREQCPYFPANTVQLHQNFPDPAQADGTEEEVMEEFRLVRNMIRDYAREFVEHFSS